MKQYLSSSSKAYKKAKAHLKDTTEVLALLKEQPAGTESGKDGTALAGTKKPENPRKRKANDVGSGDDEPSAESDFELSDDDDWKREFELVEKEAEEEAKVSIFCSLYSIIILMTGLQKRSAEEVQSLIQHINKGTGRTPGLKEPKNVVTGQKRPKVSNLYRVI
jgi:folylpolyglutamate synthase/dihydropteroate synthase